MPRSSSSCGRATRRASWPGRRPTTPAPRSGGARSSRGCSRSPSARPRLRSRPPPRPASAIGTKPITAGVDWGPRRLTGALQGKAVTLLDRCAARARVRAWEAAPDADLAVVVINDEVERFSRVKEQAVAEHDFERAARARDQADKL